MVRKVCQNKIIHRRPAQGLVPRDTTMNECILTKQFELFSLTNIYINLLHSRKFSCRGEVKLYWVLTLL